MSENHAFASLSPRLLARKGGAKPAMRRQDTSKFMSGGGAVAHAEDLGWNDWGQGHDDNREQGASPASAPVAPAARSVPAPVTKLVPATKEPGQPVSEQAAPEQAVPEVLRQIEQIAWRINQVVVPHNPVLPEGRRAAFTLRLDAERHFRLKMAAVVLNRSAQVLVTEALDKYLSEVPEIAQLQGTAKKHS
ncbi:hypothetical protein [Novosphingobium mangrovi (ex Huang et al. 2023)]|uniref:Uncharacterized protein n=1 Tax=Novosphingobium mangrovi (ex Huang et al. 2023) TaxID=2976432 RepID=A0ABT2I4L4_9SPHN|nr:hypothetical protein [Novosphingobium mangrovi (ex Huang et al. 2023)]MCT2399739.1 hypothetical protein [Novosphingobium mangrovi (ex Huang et al. 2023)]